MKKFGMLILCVVLSGCEMSYEEYVARVKWCEERGMDAVVHKENTGTVIGVNCTDSKGAVFWSQRSD